MNRHGLSAAEFRAVTAAMTQQHRVRVRVKLLDLDGKHLADLSSKLVDGQVDVDWTQNPTRKATVILDDAKRALPFDSSAPAETALYMDRMIRIYYEVLTTDWVSLPIFTGPVIDLSRDGKQVTVDCQGKEWLASGACWSPLALDKAMKKTDAIIRILSQRAGEDRFDIPDLAARLPHKITLIPDDVPWLRARHLSASMSRQLYYDGAGVCRLRIRPKHVGFVFSGGLHVVGDPQISFTGSGLVNAVRVIGAVPKGGKTHIHAQALAPATHPLSPAKLGRNGVPRYLPPQGGTIRDDSLRTHTEAQARADETLEDGLRQPVTVSFDSIPGPGAFLDPGDLCQVKTDDGSVTFRLAQFSMPLLAGLPMTVGYTDRRLSRATGRHPKHRRR